MGKGNWEEGEEWNGVRDASLGWKWEAAVGVDGLKGEAEQ